MVKGITIINGQQTLIIPFGIDGFGVVNKLKIILLFDLVSTQATGAQQFPWFFVQDKDGNVIFDNIEKTADVDIKIESTREDKGSGKVFPQLSHVMLFIKIISKLVISSMQKKILFLTIISN